MTKKLTFVTLLLAASSGLSSCGRFSEKKILETWEISNREFKVRVTSYEESGSTTIAGAYYVFRSAPAGTDAWHDIVVFRHDDPVPIPREQVHLEAEGTGYLFMGWKYAVTTDGGRTWTIWDATKNLPNWACCNYGLIHGVDLRSDGTGTMHLHPIPGRAGEVPVLCTTDYGRHWTDTCLDSVSNLEFDFENILSPTDATRLRRASTRQ
jgi:hypothetical protein